MNFEFDKQKLFLVGIAASAGGILPMRDLVSEASCHGSMSFVIVSHRPRNAASDLEKILEKASNIHSVTIEDGMEIENCKLYVLPTDSYAVLEGMHFRLSPRPKSGANNSADVFFKSMAETFKQNAIAVVLSGAYVGSDGAEGVQAVKKQGGHTYAQDPDTAEFPDMPRLAIETGKVDTIATPDVIGHELSLVAWAN